VRRARCIVAAAALLAAALAAGQVLRQVPPLETRVTDLANVLTADQRAALEARLAGLEARTGSQVAILLVPTTRPEAIEQYALRVVDAWQLGRGEVDDGVLLLIALEDRELRIEVGYGLEGAIPDARANRIIDEYITPRFRDGDFAGGINAGLDALEAAIADEPLPRPPAGPRDSGPGIDIGGMLPVLLIVAVGLGGALKRALGSLPGAAVTGGIVGMIVWFLVGILATAVVAGFIAFFISLFMAAGPGAWTSGGGYRGGFGGGHRGGFGRGGGFSGGGGGFGGGGASGGW